VTAKQRQARLERIIKEWTRRLVLEHVDIQVLWDEVPENPDALASVEVSDLYDHAEIRFGPDWPDHDVQMLNRIVVHELLHILFRDFGTAIRSVEMTGALSSDVRLIWHDRCHDAEEGLIDRLANRFVSLGELVE
jgi:hypothetical protein